MTIIDSALREYAQLLHSNGFAIYEPLGTWNHFVYSRIVDGQECFGVAEKDTVGFGYSHSMPIKPSRENGSHMFVDYADGRPVEDLTVEAARTIAQPTNWNKVVGVQKNYAKFGRYDRYIKWS